MSAVTRVSRTVAPRGSGVPGEVFVRVEMDFVLALPAGSPLPSPQIEAVDAAALCIAGGPVPILPRARVSVRLARLRGSR